MSGTTPTCTVGGCDRKHEARGYCNPHYQRWYKYGDALHSFPTVEERFWARVDRTAGPDGCWPWLGSLHSSGRTGYGWTGKELAHRQAFVYTHGRIEVGRELDHVCHTREALAGNCAGGACAHRLCVNPAHLELTSHRENALRGMSPGAITYRNNVCRRGHRMEGANVYVVPRTGARRCLACVALREIARAAA